MRDEYMVAAAGPGPLLGLSRNSFVTFPALRVMETGTLFASAKDAADYILDIDRFNIFAVAYQPFPGRDRWDAECLDLETTEAFSVEIMRGAIRFYMRPQVDAALTREELQGQRLNGIAAVERICAAFGVEATRA